MVEKNPTVANYLKEKQGKVRYRTFLFKSSIYLVQVLVYGTLHYRLADSSDVIQVWVQALVYGMLHYCLGDSSDANSSWA